MFPAVVIPGSLAFFLVAQAAQLLQIFQSIVCVDAVLVIHFGAQLETRGFYQGPIYYARETQSAAGIGATILLEASDTWGQGPVHITVSVARVTENSVAHVTVPNPALPRHTRALTAQIDTSRSKV